MDVDKGQARYRTLFETMSQGVVFQDADGRITDANRAAERILGLSLAQMQGRTSRDPRWRSVHEDGSDFLGDEHPAMVALQTGEDVRGVVMGVFNPEDDQYRWITIDAFPLCDDGADRPVGAYATFTDITAQKRAQRSLRDIEWMLSPLGERGEQGLEPEPQPYGDLTELNSDRTILDAVGADTLRLIVADFLELMETSAAVYEKNGDYAMGIFSSRWCRRLDGVSRRLCATDDDGEALASGEWLCHESCWTDCSRVAIAEGRAVEIDCHGGLRLYAVPIVAGGEVVGSINVGYGDPPDDPDELQEIADRYHVPLQDLRREAAGYRARPAFIVDLAKRRLHSAARLIGEIVERRQAQERWRSYVESAPYGVFVADEQGRYLQVNREACRISGYSEAELLSMSIFDLLPDEWRDVAARRFALLGREVRGAIDLEFVTRSGDRRWAAVSAVRLSDSRILGFTDDITERKLAGEALRESEAFLDTVMQGSPYAMWIADSGGTVVRTNDALLQSLDLPAEQIVGAYNVLQDENLMLQGVMPQVRAVFQDLEPTRFTIPWSPEHAGDVDFSGGRSLHIDASIIPIVGSGGELQNVVCQWVDVSDRVDAESALRERVKELTCLHELSKLVGRPEATESEILRGAVELLPPAVQHADASCARIVFEGDEYTSEGFSVTDQRIGVPLRIGASEAGVVEVFYLEEQPHADEGPFLLQERELLEVVSHYLERALGRRRAEEALRESEDRLRLAMEAAGEGIWEWDFATDVVTFDEVGASMLGYGVGEIEASGEWWIGQIHPEDRPGVERVFYDYLRGRADGYSALFRLRRKDGDYVWVTSHARIVRRDERGEPQLCVGIHRDITEERRAEEERLAIYREQAYLLRSMSNAFVIFESVFDDDGTFVSYRFEYINDAYEQITGVTLDEVRGKTVHEVWPETEPSWIENYGAVAVSGTTRRFEMFHKPTDKMYDCTVYRPWDTSDRFCVVFEDITERKAVENAIRESEEKFRSLFESAEVLVSVYDRDGMCQLMNRKVAGFFGAEPQDFVGRSFDDLHGELGPEYTRRVREVIDTGSAAEYEDEVPFPEGSRWLITTVHPVRDAEGVVRTAQIISHDITDRKLVEEALQRSERRLRQAQHIARMGDVTWNVETGEVWWSDGMHELAGYERTEAFDYERVNREIHHSDDLERVTQWLGECVASGERTITPNEYRIVRKDGEVLWVHVEGVVERDEGAGTTILATVQDITDRQAAEQAIAKLNAELEQRVLDRTAALEAVNTELESMTYSVSHDLRAPVRHIAGFADLLRKSAGKDLDEGQRHYLERIAASVGQMGDLIDDLLEFSRTGRIELKLTDVDMVAAYQAALETVRPHIGDREIVWVIGDLPPVRGDEGLLRLVWTNLLDNAVKFTRPRERAHIEVAAESGDGELVYSVRDNGVGFDPRYAGKMFGVFQRMHPFDEFEGTGVGLANVRRAIARLGGRTWAEGEIDKGATFYFTVPVRKEA